MLSYLSYLSQDCLPRDGATYNELGSPESVSRQDSAPQASPVKAVLQLRLHLPGDSASVLCCRLICLCLWLLRVPVLLGKVLSPKSKHRKRAEPVCKHQTKLYTHLSIRV